MADDNKKPTSLITGFAQACGLLLLAAIALTVALTLLARIWVWLLLLSLIAGIIWTVIWIVRWRRDRRW